MFLVMQPFAWERLKARCCCKDIERDTHNVRYALGELNESDMNASIEESVKSVFSGPGGATTSSAMSGSLQAVYAYMDEEELAQEIESVLEAAPYSRDAGLLSSMRDSYDEQLLS